MIALLCFLAELAVTHGFLVPKVPVPLVLQQADFPPQQQQRSTTTIITRLGASSSSSSSYDMEAAGKQLVWETLEEVASRPLLNLSFLRDADAAMVASDSQKTLDHDDDDDDDDDTSDWDQGQRWSQTQQGLNELLGVEDDDSDENDNGYQSFLQKCPQLLRLEPSMVLETAQWIVQELDAKLILAEPRLLSFRQTDASYGLEFMSIMMMMPSQNLKVLIMGSGGSGSGSGSGSAGAPELLLSGIEGGIQERAVQKSLGAAAEATSKASQTIAGDAMASLKSIQQQRRKNGL